ncbi:hypothetical protein ACP70R_037818 [Stipagrostis hirtigluma subsp. patula]
MISKEMRKPSHGRMPPLQTMAVVAVVSALASPALGSRPDVKCKCFMCVCDLDPHPLPPETPVPVHHSPPPVPVSSPPPPSPSPPPPVPVSSPPPPPTPALTAYYPPPVYYYYPPMPYGYPWAGAGAAYGPPAAEMYPRDRGAVKSGAHRRQVGHDGGSRLLLAVVLASSALSLLLPCT